MGMITTIHGLIEECELRKVEGGFEDDKEATTWVEYYLGDELVHRSAHVRLKKHVSLESQVQGFS